MGEGRHAVPLLEVFFDFACPFCSLVVPVLDRLQPRPAVRWRAYELRPAPVPFPEAGFLLAARQRAEALVPSFGAQWTATPVPSRTRLAHEAVAFAARADAADALVRAVFAAHFRDGLDIGRIDVLARLAAAAGLAESELVAALKEGTRADTVAEDRARAQQLGIAAVPAFVLHGGNGADAIRIGWQTQTELADWLSMNSGEESR